MALKKTTRNQGFCIPGDIFLGTKTLPFLEPSGLCVHDGWLYVADSKTHMVSRWMLKDASVGQLVAGGQGPGDALEQLNRPTAVAVDAAGRVYVSDARWISCFGRGSCWEVLGPDWLVFLVVHLPWHDPFGMGKWSSTTLPYSLMILDVVFA